MQAIAMLSGDMPRSKTDAERLKKLKQLQPASAGGWLTVPSGFIDEPILIDGIGEKTAAALKASGVLSISQIAGMSNVDLAEVTSELNISGYEVKQEWKAQASAMLSGKPPRSKADQERLKKLEANRETVEDVTSDLTPPDGFIENVILIDGIGEKTALALRNAGVSKISQIATMPEGDLAKVVSRIGIPGFEKTQEWQEQSIEMLKGNLPRSLSDQEKLKTLIEERVAAKLKFEQQVAEAENNKVVSVEAEEVETEEVEIADVEQAETIEVEQPTVNLGAPIAEDVVEDVAEDIIEQPEDEAIAMPSDAEIDSVEEINNDEINNDENNIDEINIEEPVVEGNAGLNDDIDHGLDAVLNENVVDSEIDEDASIEAVIADLSGEPSKDEAVIDEPTIDDVVIEAPLGDEQKEDAVSIEQLFDTESQATQEPSIEASTDVDVNDDVADFINTLDSETSSQSVEINSDIVDEAPSGAGLEEDFTLDDILSEMNDDENNQAVDVNADIDASIADVSGEAPETDLSNEAFTASLDTPSDPVLDAPEFISDLGSMEAGAVEANLAEPAISKESSFSFVRAFGCFGMLALLGGAAYAGWENKELVQSYSQQALSSVRNMVGIQAPNSSVNPEMEKAVETNETSTKTSNEISNEGAEVKTLEPSTLERAVIVLEDASKDAENTVAELSETKLDEKNNQRLGLDGQTQVEEIIKPQVSDIIEPVVIEPVVIEPIASPTIAQDDLKPEIVQPVQLGDTVQEGATKSVTDAAQVSEPVDIAKAEGVQALSITGEKAFLYEEASSASGANREEARVSWHLDKVSPGEGQPQEAVIKGSIDIPAKGLSLNLSISRNVDAGLPASHIVELIFTNTESFAGRGIDSVPRLVMKSTEEARGEGLVGVPAKIDNGFFFVALNNLPQAVETNEKLLLGSDWIDIPMGYLSGRRALVVMQKGETGTKVFQDAFNDWRNR